MLGVGGTGTLPGAQEPQSPAFPGGAFSARITWDRIPQLNMGQGMSLGQGGRKGAGGLRHVPRRLPLEAPGAGVPSRT